MKNSITSIKAKQQAFVQSSLNHINHLNNSYICKMIFFVWTYIVEIFVGNNLANTWARGLTIEEWLT